MTGTLGILNVGAGDVKVSFDNTNPAEVIRAGRIVKDMLKRGYALLVEVERNGKKAFERAQGFDENTMEYIVADFDPLQAHDAEMDEKVSSLRKERGMPPEESLDDGPSLPKQAYDAKTGGPQYPEGPGKTGNRGRRGRLPAKSTRAVAVPRTSGG